MNESLRIFEVFELSTENVDCVLNVSKTAKSAQVELTKSELLPRQDSRRTSENTGVYRKMLQGKNFPLDEIALAENETTITRKTPKTNFASLELT